MPWSKQDEATDAQIPEVGVSNPPSINSGALPASPTISSASGVGELSVPASSPVVDEVSLVPDEVGQHSAAPSGTSPGGIDSPGDETMPQSATDLPLQTPISGEPDRGSPRIHR